MQVFEITGYKSGIERSGVSFLDPIDAFENLENGYIYRQVLQSRLGFKQFSTGALSDGLRVMGIFTNFLRDSTKETLAVTLNHLYRYNTATDTFDLVPTGGSLGGAHLFNIASNDEYVSGTTYPLANGGDRFVFTSSGMTHVYQYFPPSALNPLGLVTDYTNAADNPDYQAFAGGALTNAKHVIFFGERINFFYPTIAGNPNPQGILFSAIRTAAGNGDKFNTSGSGLILLDTVEFISGASILGNVIAMNLTDSNWTLEKTQDAFNPYRPRRIPSVIGTNADFSFAQWGNEVMSIGLTGIITTDGRVSNRADDKIPFFTRDDIDQANINLTYGGFDRNTSQFLFSYLSADAPPLTTTQNKVLVGNYEERSWSVYDMSFSVFGETFSGLNLTWDDIYEVNDPSWLEWNTTEKAWDQIGLGQNNYKCLAGDDNGFIYELDQDCDDYYTPITGVVNSNPAVLLIDPTNFAVGDQVVISGVQGMTEINNFDPTLPYEEFTPYTVVAFGPGTVTILENSIPFGIAVPNTGAVSKIINFSAETIPFNPWREKGLRIFISHVEFLLSTNSGNLLVDVFQNEENAPFKQNILIQPTAIGQSRQWVSMVVDNEADFMTFRMRQSSPALQVKLVSMRIHCSPGALTSY